MSEIKAIETAYKGHRFRSRTEARWAVFFDALGIEWQYELEGFQIGDHWYLPDFYLPRHRIWVEVKPDHYYRPECDALAAAKKQVVLVVFGQPGIGKYGIDIYDGTSDNTVEWIDPEHSFGFALGRKNDDELWVKNEDGARCFNSLDDCGKWPLEDAEKLLGAYDKAQSARFEFGETPQ